MSRSTEGHRSADDGSACALQGVSGRTNLVHVDHREHRIFVLAAEAVDRAATRHRSKKEIDSLGRRSKIEAESGVEIPHMRPSESILHRDFEASMLPLRSPGMPLRLAKTVSGFAALLLCLLLSAPSPLFAYPDLGGRSAYNSLVRHHVREALSLTDGGDGEDANAMCYKMEGYPGRFPYLCSLRMAGSRKHSCTATLVGRRWVVTAAHCIDPMVKNSVGCYPVIYCGIDDVDTISEEKTFHVEEAYLHKDWTHKIELGSDIAMLKLDKQAPLELPRLFREGMVYDDETKMVTPGWGLENGATECSGQGYMRVHSEKHNRCRKPLKSVPKDSWLCFCEDSKSTRESLDGSPLTLVDWPCELDKGYPSEDLVVGVLSFDPVNEDRGGSGDPPCSAYSSVSYYRNWMMKVMAGKVPRSKCKTPPKEKPSPPPPDLSVCKKPLEACKTKPGEPPEIKVSIKKPVVHDRPPQSPDSGKELSTEPPAMCQRPKPTASQDALLAELARRFKPSSRPSSIAPPETMRPSGTSFGCSPPKGSYINDCGRENTPETCAAKGCCWSRDLYASHGIQCFHVISKYYKYCANHLHRSNCGTSRSTEEECQRRGCCYNRSEFSDVVCFYPNTELDPETCKVFPLAAREPCGYFANQNSCEEHGCCWWKTSEDKKDTWCYKAKTTATTPIKT